MRRCSPEAELWGALAASPAQEQLEGRAPLLMSVTHICALGQSFPEPVGIG